MAFFLPFLEIGLYNQFSFTRKCITLSPSPLINRHAEILPEKIIPLNWPERLDNFGLQFYTKGIVLVRYKYGIELGQNS
jgi:hypothetical protein